MKNLHYNSKLKKCIVFTQREVIIKTFTQMPYKQARELIKWKDKNRKTTPINELTTKHLSLIIKMLLNKDAKHSYNSRTYQEWYDIFKKEQRFRLLERRYNSFIKEFLDEEINEPLIIEE